MKKVKYYFFICALPLFSDLKAEIRLKPFVTDGCTLFLDGPPDTPNLWKKCCVEHDLRYWFGGTIEDRKKADLHLRSCVEKLSTKKWAMIIYHGVRAGHYSPVKNKHHWGWGWNLKRKNISLSQDENRYILNELQNLNLEGVDLYDFIKTYFP